MNTNALKFTYEKIDGIYFLDTVSIKNECSEYNVYFDEFLTFKGKYIVENLNYWLIFILYELKRRNFQAIVEDKVRLVNNSYTYLVNSENECYQILIKTNYGRIEIQSFDKKFGTHLDNYKKQAKIEYMDDLDAILHALDVLEKNNIDDCLTIGTAAVKYFKNLKYCHSSFTWIDDKQDEFVRKSYSGGICQKFEDKYYGKITAIDCNSLYPYVMKKYPMPVGNGKFFKGDNYGDYLYVQHIKCYVTLKEKAMPCLFEDTMFMEGTDPIYFGEIDRIMTSVDIDNMFKCYNVVDLERLEGFKYKYAYGIFNNYINTFYKLKRDSKNVDMGTYYIAKVMLNSLGGKFATKRKFTRTVYNFKENDTLDTSREDLEATGWYVPLAAFMTAYARKELIDMFNRIQKHKDEFCLLYCDTDSLYIKGDIPEEVMEYIDDYELGKWKNEGTFIAGKFLKQKVYAVLREDGTTKYTVAGCTESAKSNLTWDTFKEGTVLKNRVFKRALGGCDITEAPFIL